MGNDDEVELAARLREVLDAPVPPSRIDVDAVISRGRRRLALWRAGAVLGVVAVVGGISFAALALRGVGGGGAQIPPAAAPVTTAAASSGQPAQAWSPVSRSPSQGARCDAAPPLPPVALGPKSDAPAAAFVAVLRGVPGQRHIGDPVTVPHKEDAISLDVVAEVSDADGVGSVHLSRNPHAGDPLAAANKDADRRAGCDTFFRTVRASGAVLQLREKMMVPAPQTTTNQTTLGRVGLPLVEPTPELAIYLPNVEGYYLTESRYGWASSKVSSTVPPYTAPRKTLPLTDRQLQAVAEDLVARLGF